MFRGVNGPRYSVGERSKSAGPTAHCHSLGSSPTLRSICDRAFADAWRRSSDHPCQKAQDLRKGEDKKRERKAWEARDDCHLE